MKPRPSDSVISVEHVSKDFLLPHEKTNSIKGAFVGMYKKHSKTHEVQHALHDINLEVKKGEFFGIVGRNGSGKSTLLKILAGIYQPTEGSVRTIGKLVPFIELGVGFNPELTGRENVYLNGAMLGFARKEIDAMYDDIVAFAELERFMDQKLKNYSSGMQVRLAFSMATRAEADMLLVDEVLAVGDADFQRKCFEYFRQLKKNNKTVIFVSHDMGAIREYCDRGVLIEGSKIILSGKANQIADEYTRLFIPSDKHENAQRSKERVGNGKLRFVGVEFPRRVTAADKHITIVLNIQSKDSVPAGTRIGFKLSDPMDRPLMGTNNELAGEYTRAMKSGDKYELTYRFENLLNEGKYSLEVLAESADGEIYDWWVGAAACVVYKEKRTGYPVEPAISLKMKKI
jgi:ABC-2 type transport system ATP-binding protein